MTEAASTGVQLIDEPLIEATLERARNSPRLRANYNLHASHDDRYHRFLNAWVRGTYAAPHRHITVPKAETFVVLRGKLVCFIFDDAGKVIRRTILGEGGVQGIDIAAGLWHTLLPVTDVAVALEIKLGPWDPEREKDFPPWAPLEGDPRAAAYAQALLTDSGQV